MSRVPAHAVATAASGSDSDSDVDMDDGAEGDPPTAAAAAGGQSHSVAAAAVAAAPAVRIVRAEPWLVESVWRAASGAGAAAAADPTVHVRVSVDGPSMALPLPVPASSSFLDVLSHACRELRVPVERVRMARSTEHAGIDYLQRPDCWPAVWRAACQRASHAAQQEMTGHTSQHVGLELYMASADEDDAPLCFVDANRQPLEWAAHRQAQISPALVADATPASQHHCSWLLAPDGFRDSTAPSLNPLGELPLSLGLEHWRMCFTAAGSNGKDEARPVCEEYPAMLVGVMAALPLPPRQQPSHHPPAPLSLSSLDGSRLRVQQAKLFAPLTRAILSRHSPRVRFTVRIVHSARPELIGDRAKCLNLLESHRPAGNRAAPPIVFDSCDIFSEQLFVCPDFAHTPSLDGRPPTSFSLLLHATSVHEADGYIVSAAEVEQLHWEPYRAWLRDAQLRYLGASVAPGSGPADAARVPPLPPITGAHVLELKRAPSIPLFLLLDLDKTVILNEKNHRQSRDTHNFECHFSVATPEFGGLPTPVMLRREADALLQRLHNKFNIHVLTAGVLEYGRGVVRAANQCRWNGQHSDGQPAAAGQPQARYLQ